ncbi:vitamin K epoxide reductase family protein [Luteimonas sp. RD2P54]|uniref:Vitamin K epoxide reductase family protein n=1 Tax=Luteimonas endophytica TaxID=3042023 RepID=A0ABT6J664_9GAMM|nr:vitamin K epoxide reductase family protein [Luteimonas endophytica]MDH5822310.1 vitamin K epoxide reductase family protein [Luteimonas endophytica]
MARKKRKQSRQSSATAAAAAPASAPRAHAQRVPVDRPVLALAALGVLLTGYLTAAAWGDAAPALCTEGGGCDLIAGSRWSTLFGLPIALWGLAMYALIGLAAATGRSAAQRWRRLSRLSLVGLAISVYLTAAGLLALRATCGWCLASLATMAAIFALVHVRRGGAPAGRGRGAWWLGGGLLALGAVLALHVAASGVLDRRPENPRVVALVAHLEAIDAKYYGASWCGNCRRQTRLFGASAPRLPYVECSPQGRGGPVARECVAAGVGSYPTWVVHGLHHVGVLTPEELAQLSGFDWERER